MLRHRKAPNQSVLFLSLRRDSQPDADAVLRPARLPRRTDVSKHAIPSLCSLRTLLLRHRKVPNQSVLFSSLWRDSQPDADAVLYVILRVGGIAQFVGNLIAYL